MSYWWTHAWSIWHILECLAELHRRILEYRYGLILVQFSHCLVPDKTEKERYMGCVKQKGFWQVWTAKAQISLHIRAVWSGPSLSANRIIGYYRMYQSRGKTQKILWACAGWIWICAFVCDWRQFFTWNSPYGKYPNSNNEPAHHKIYYKTITLRLAWTSTQYGKSSLLSIFW